MTAASDPIFVVGTGRSGTTLLRLMLCAHRRIYITHEASFYSWEKRFPRRAPRRAFLDHYFHTHSFRWLRLDPARVLAAFPDPLPHERTGEVFAAVMREKAAQYGRTRFGDKTPLHSQHLARIFEDFPAARVVYIVRDPRGTALSLSRMPWASGSLYANAIYCEVDRRAVAPFRDRVLEIKLEDLLADPRSTMGRVLDYVGEDWDEAVLDHARNIPDKNDMPPLPWLESAARDRGAPAANWSDLSPTEIRLIEKVARRTMIEAGYPPAKLPYEPGKLAVAWACVRQLPEALRCLTVFLRLAKRMRDPQNLDSAETAALFRTVNPKSWALYPGFAMPTPPALPSRVG